MKRILIALLITFGFVFQCNVMGQKIESYDTILIEKCYKAFYNYSIKAPSFVIYKLYNGGGDVSRSGMNFKTRKGIPHFNYSKTQYDRGHLCPAEDFAYDEDLMRSTFYYHNAVPQTIRLNRGIWKTYETRVRRDSRKDSLIIVCGGCDYYGSYVPKRCFKLVYSLSTKKLIYCILVTNDNVCTLKLNRLILMQKFSFERIMALYNKKGDS